VPDSGTTMVRIPEVSSIVIQDKVPVATTQIILTATHRGPLALTHCWSHNKHRVFGWKQGKTKQHCYCGITTQQHKVSATRVFFIEVQQDTSISFQQHGDVFLYHTTIRC
jgi:hypothetical protein